MIWPMANDSSPLFDQQEEDERIARELGQDPVELGLAPPSEEDEDEWYYSRFTSQRKANDITLLP